MKRFFTLTVFSLLITFCNAQSVDTLSILKTNAENYIFNKIPNPKSYKSLGWSEIFKTNNEETIYVLDHAVLEHKYLVVGQFVFNSLIKNKLKFIAIITANIYYMFAV